ncbi:hypothetical protein TRICI_004957 [Trichomonascus ciferrii]|uniref:Pentacotripeptide-repeat region of PRORP domain-containing protein n=1 Tax=Trichomonascus ciferrii TaxID=44093 RepID=A0A642V2W6_9ASCO|nr:hypothetical protein TRICI_004957 [Trichomonascus ciferrii]
MLLKSLSRHAVLAKNFGASSSNTTTPFFVSTNHLARYQSQVAVKGSGGSSFGNNGSKHSAHNGTTSGGMTAAGVNFSSFSPLTSLDDEKQQVLIENGAVVHRFQKKDQLLRPSLLAKQELKNFNKTHDNNKKQQKAYKVSKTSNKRRIEATANDNGEGDSNVLTKEETDLVTVSELHLSGEHLRVVEYFENLRLKDVIPSLDVYNVVLSSVATLCAGRTDLSPLLEVYSDMVSNKVVPDVTAYSIVIEELLCAARDRLEFYNDSVLFNGVKNRHNINALNSVLSHLDVIEEAKSYVQLAVKIFNASNSVRVQEFSPELYGMLDTICGIFDLASPVETPTTTSSIIKKHFTDNNILEAISEYHQNMTDKNALCSVIDGFVQVEDYESAWNWIQHAELDPEFTLPLTMLENTLASFCGAGQVSLATALFDHISTVRCGSNRAASDYVTLCIEAQDAENVYKTIRETQVRGGVWDHSTVVEVVKYLINVGDVDLSMKVFQAQSQRLAQYVEDKMSKSSETSVDLKDFGSEALEDVFFHLKDTDNLTLDTLLALGNSPFHNKSVLSEIIQNLWGYKELPRLTTMEILSIHNRWLNEEIPQGIVGLEARENYKRLVDEIAYGQLDDAFISEVNNNLMRLGLDMGQWWNRESSIVMKIISDEKLEQNYQHALQTLPHPSTSQEAYDQWVEIHRAVVSHGEKEVATAAYKNLLDMGSFPDATGYGKLIAADDAIDSASDALILFNEAVMNVRPTTFLYNVLLAKLSKARRLKEALMYFQDMERGGVKRSNVTYGTMISAACRAGDEELAKQLFDEMEAKFPPTIAPFNIMLQHYVHTKRRKEALQVYNRLKQVCIPSPHTYKLLIDMYTIEPIDIKAAEQVLEMIPYPTTQHYSALIYAKGVEQRDLEGAKAVYKGEPDELIYQALLESYVINDVDPTEVLLDMEKNRVKLNAYMANILIRGWAPNNLQKSVGLFYHILENKIAEPSSYESIIRAYLHHGDVTSATNVLMIMRMNSYPEPVIAKVQTLIESNNGDLIESIFRHI